MILSVRRSFNRQASDSHYTRMTQTEIHHKPPNLLRQFAILAALGTAGFAATYGTMVLVNREPRKSATAQDQPNKPQSSLQEQKVDEAPTEIKFAATVENKKAPANSAPKGMVWIPGGEFSMGCEDPRGCLCGGKEAMLDARPIHRVYVDGFWMDEWEVTNEQFARFVEATGYVTIAEQTPRAEDFPGAPPENLVAGSIVFTPTPQPVPLDNHFRWWSYIPGTNWRHPLGPDSDIVGKEKFPVVQVSYADAVAYCEWAKKRLPTEAEWEFAARGGEAGKLYTWGDEFKPKDKWMVNIFQGTFPVEGGDAGEDGFVGIAPTAQFPVNRYGLYDMAGNVWEWCADWYRHDYYQSLVNRTRVARNPPGPTEPFDPSEPHERKRVQRGGSFLCTDKYCTRYMLGTRGKGEFSSSSNHVGFRCVKSP